MLRKMTILFPAVLLGAAPFAAMAETMDQSELDMFRTAAVSAQQAGDAAMKAHSGALASVAFGDEDGRAAYEAVVVGADGQPWTVLIDARNGEVFASALSSAMKDQEDGDDHDGETNDD